MKRPVTVCMLAISIVIVQSCNRSSTPSGETAGAAGTTAPGGPVQNIIWLAANNGHSDTTVDAPCTGTVTAYRVTVQRKQPLLWHVKNDEFNPCPNPQYAMVKVVFTNAILAQSNPNDPAVNEATSNNGGQIQSRVHKDAPDRTIQKYLVRYMNMKASPDPELDIQGDCGPCGPGGGQ